MIFTATNIYNKTNTQADMDLYKFFLHFLNLDLSRYSQSFFNDAFDETLNAIRNNIELSDTERYKFMLVYLVEAYLNSGLGLTSNYEKDGRTYLYSDKEYDKNELEAYKNNLREEKYNELKKFQSKIKKIINEISLGKTDFTDIENTTLKIGYNIVFEEGQIHETYQINEIDTYCLFMITKIINSNLVINRCENCGSFFIPTTRSDEKYCNKVHSNGRTCKDMGYENKINSDDIMKEYRRAYKNKNAIKNRNKHNSNAEKTFKQWVYAAKLKLEDCREGIITLDEFKEWLNNN